MGPNNFHGVLYIYIYIVYVYILYYKRNIYIYIAALMLVYIEGVPRRGRSRVHRGFKV